MITSSRHRSRTAWITCIATLLAALSPAFANEIAGREWNFDVFLDGKPIGAHRYALRENGGALELVSEARFRVRILFVNAYRYDHDARERWQGDCLDTLEARTDANGKSTVVNGQRAGADFRIRSGSASVLVKECVQTFAYWNPRILTARRLLNPQTGEYVDVEISSLGRETVGGQQAERYRLTSQGPTPLKIDLWYSLTNDWVALESLTPEGRRLRYARK